MALRSDAILEAFVQKIINNSEIMNILNLPTINEKDSQETKKKKRKLLIDKAITKSAQSPYELGKEFPEITINNKTYKNYADTRITISFAQSIKLRDDIFGNPQVDINIYYDNTKMDNVFNLLDLISDTFSGQNLEVITKDGNSYLRNLRQELISSQVAIINNYERVGIRFSFYATVYKN